MSFKCIVNGYAIDYARTEFDDGSVAETGLPAGMKSRPSIEELAAYAFNPPPPARAKIRRS
jgi:hypothetical protein